MQVFLQKPSALDDILALALREPTLRIRPFLGPNGERLWLKRSNGRSTFTNELRALQILGRAGLPVPDIMAEGPDHFVMSDVGPTLAHLLGSSGVPFTKRAAACRAAGAAIGRLHTAGYAHGRPVLHDICWDGGYAYFIDLERFSPNKASVRHRALDLLIFTQSCIAEMGSAGPFLDLAIEAYRAAAPAEALRPVQRLAAWCYPLGALMAPVLSLWPGAKGISALPKTFAYLRSL